MRSYTLPLILPKLRLSRSKTLEHQLSQHPPSLAREFFRNSSREIAQPRHELKQNPQKFPPVKWAQLLPTVSIESALIAQTKGRTMMISSEMYESFYNDFEDKPNEEETSVEAITTSDDSTASSNHRSSPTAASLFFCLPIERAETAITEVPKVPKLLVAVEGGIVRHDSR